jgi:hypothetical protein
MRIAWITAIVPLALLAAGCGGTEGAGTGASDLIPATAPAYVALDTNPDSDQWKKVEALASHFPDKAKGEQDLKDSFSKDSGIDWDRDLKPALGDEVDLVWLDFKGDGDHFVALTQPRDAKKFDAFAKKATAHDPSNPVLHDSFKGWEVVSDKQANIDRFERESSSAADTLTNQPAFEHAMDTLGPDSIMRAFVDGSTIMRLVNEGAGPGERPFIKKIGTLDWIAARVGAKDDGVASDTIVHGTPGQLFKGTPHGGAFTPTLTKTVPQDALAYWTFHGTKNMLSGLQNNPVLATPELRQFSGVLKSVGRLLQGENALYVRAPASGRIPEVTLVASPGGGVDGAAVLDRLLTRFAGQIGTRPKRTSIAGTHSRTLGFGPASLHYANVNGRLVLTDLPQGLQGVQHPGTALAQGGEFKDAKTSAGMPDKTQGFVYINIHSTVPAVERLSHAKLPSQVSRNLKPLRSAMEYAVSRSHEMEISAFLRIK